jgi:hypothetical protein
MLAPLPGHTDDLRPDPTAGGTAAPALQPPRQSALQACPAPRSAGRRGRTLTWPGRTGTTPPAACDPPTQTQGHTTRKRPCYEHACGASSTKMYR